MAERIIEAWEERLPRLEPLCRMLLVADRFGVTLLRGHCLHCLAARFEALVEERAPPREREVFEAFVAAIAPQVPVLACPCGADVLRYGHADQVLSVLESFQTPLVACFPCRWACGS